MSDAIVESLVPETRVRELVTAAVESGQRFPLFPPAVLEAAVMSGLSYEANARAVFDRYGLDASTQDELLAIGREFGGDRASEA
jgi:hypothetical protein